MAFEGAQMVPVYDMNKSDGDGFMGGGAGWMWVVMLFFLLAWGGGFGGFGGNGANGAVNTLTNEFLYTNLNNTIDRGFNQLANQNFGIQKDICESTGALQMGLCQGFNQTNAAIAESRFAAQQCCCETNRNIDAVRAENYKNTCEITTAIHAEAEATRALMTANVMQELRDQLQAAQLQLGNLSQTQNIINAVRPFPQPAYITCSPYTSANGFGCNNGCGCI
ncbi:MAG: hypothetical protein ACLUTP_06635 [Terrisporobacter sp.]|mgnify:FL=1|jgi:hypothetical protein|uniref:hypothetical protein n=1 Tax=Terrisporobacter sp. TaxID=1965305 RepID=UPI00399C437F